MKDNIIVGKSKAFALRIIKMYQHLCDEKHEFVMSKQILRSGTSIGANIAEAQCGISEKDFLAKMYIAFKECNETKYWLDLLHESGYISDAQFDSVNTDCLELLKLLTSITKTAKQSNSKKGTSNERSISVKASDCLL